MLCHNPEIDLTRFLSLTNRPIKGLMHTVDIETNDTNNEACQTNVNNYTHTALNRYNYNVPSL